MSKKKVVMFIVEGWSDETLLSILNSYDLEEFKFCVAREDITAKNGVNPENIIKKLNDFIDRSKKDIKKKYKVKEKDFLGVILLTDLDGAFIDEFNIIEDITAERCIYEPPYIKTAEVDNIIERNRQKRENIIKLSNTNSIKNLPFRILFCSCNLEHVFEGNIVYGNDEKENISLKFAEKYEDDMNGFFEFLSDESLIVGNGYRDSWDYINLHGDESISRHSNLNLLLDLIEDIKEQIENINIKKR